MTKEVQWLLVGGPQHGKVIWTKADARVSFFDSLDEIQHYVGEDRIFDGKVYRIGKRLATLEELAQINDLIVSTGLGPLP